MNNSTQSCELWNMLCSAEQKCWQALCYKALDRDARNLGVTLATSIIEQKINETAAQGTNATNATNYVQGQGEGQVSTTSMILTMLDLILSSLLPLIIVVIVLCSTTSALKSIDPTYNEVKASAKQAQELVKKIGLKGVKFTKYELCILCNLVDPLSIVSDWKDIGGLEDIIQDIQDNLILPFTHRNLFTGSGLVQAPKGVLLYGPPGCGKTMIAKATAKETGARFINLQLSSLFDKWYGESQKRAEAVFSLAQKIQPTIIFIDEIDIMCRFILCNSTMQAVSSLLYMLHVDSFLRKRGMYDQETTLMVKTQFMSLWDGLLTDPNSQVMVMGATNRPSDLDPAILRRLPLMYHVKLPNQRERTAILNLILKNEKLDETVDIDQIASRTEGFSGSDLRELCRSAAICRVHEFLHAKKGSDEIFEGVHDLRAISKPDFGIALTKWQRGKMNLCCPSGDAV